ncbi:MAG: hypothetical protein AAFW84_06845 [Cyanobacteria bacterium J06635_15]
MTWTVGTALQNGNYVIDSIASQYPSQIYAATQIMTGQPVWLKPIAAIAPDSPDQTEAAKSYIAAIEKLNQLAHKQYNILTPLAAFQAEGELVLVQPAYPPTLAQYLARAKPFTEVQALHHLDRLLGAAQVSHQLHLPEVNLHPQSLRFEPKTHCLYITELLRPKGLFPGGLNDYPKSSPSTLTAAFQHGADARTAAILLIYLLTGVLSDAPVEHQLALVQQLQPSVSNTLIQAIRTALSPAAGESSGRINQLDLFQKFSQAIEPRLIRQAEASQPQDSATSSVAKAAIGLKLPGLPKASPVNITAPLSPALISHPNSTTITGEVITELPPQTSSSSQESRPINLQPAMARAPSGRATTTPSSTPTEITPKPAQPRNQPTIRRIPIILSVAGIAGLLGIGFGSMLRFSALPQTSGIRLNPEQAFPPQSNWPIVEDTSDFNSYYDGPLETNPNPHNINTAPISPVNSSPPSNAESQPETTNDEISNPPLETSADDDNELLDREAPNLEVDNPSNFPDIDISPKLPPPAETFPNPAGSVQPEAPVVTPPDSENQGDDEAGLPPISLPQASMSTE